MYLKYTEPKAWRLAYLLMLYSTSATTCLTLEQSKLNSRHFIISLQGCCIIEDYFPVVHCQALYWEAGSTHTDACTHKHTHTHSGIPYVSMDGRRREKLNDHQLCYIMKLISIWLVQTNTIFAWWRPGSRPGPIIRLI